jgi:ABC-type Fe3+-hydroxamate transport system substrate-binding protein
MSQIEKFISPFIAQQFPSFYREEGPNFIAFVKAYYEWMEETGKVTDRTKNLLNYTDIDKTSEEFLKFYEKRLVEYKDFLEKLLEEKKLKNLKNYSSPNKAVFCFTPADHFKPTLENMNLTSDIHFLQACSRVLGCIRLKQMMKQSVLA